MPGTRKLWSAFPAKATEVRGVVAIPALGLSIPLDIIYRGLL